MDSRDRLNEFVAKYLDTECLLPRIVKNRYTGQKLYVGCGTCMSCLLKKANSQTALASSMASHFKYIFFVTLKYNELYLPKLTFLHKFADSDCDNSNQLTLHLSSERVLPPSEKRVPMKINVNYSSTTKTIFDIVKKASGRFSPVQKRVIYPLASQFQNYIPYIDKEDFFTFLKRLRINIQRKTKSNEKICYYAVSEYGPRTLRPHWHLLLFTNSYKISQNLVSRVREAWQYGSIDISPSRGHAASYCSSYLNSFACLPSFYQQYPTFRPRCFHSKGFSFNAQFLIPKSINDLSVCSSQAFSGIDVPIDGKYVNVKYSRSLKNLLFPRFNETVFEDSSRIYSLVRAVLRSPQWLLQHGYIGIDFPDFFDVDDKENGIIGFKTKAFSRALASYLYANYPIHQNMSTLNQRDDDFNYIILSLHKDPYTSDFSFFELLSESVYRLVLKIRRWLLAWHLHPYQTDFYKNIKILIDASLELRDKERMRALNDYFLFNENCSELAREYLRSTTLNNNDYNLKLSDACKKNLRSNAFVRFSSRIKHKEYNDIAGLLLT